MQVSELSNMKKIFFSGALLLGWGSLWAQAPDMDRKAGLRALEYENYNAAKQIFQSLVSHSRDPLDHYYLGMAHVYLGEFDAAQQAFTKGVELDPKSMHNYIGLGRVQLEKNQVAKAKEFFDKARSLTSAKDITYLNLVADAYASAQYGDAQQALTLLNRSVELNNKNAETYYLLGKTYEAMGVARTGEAANAYERAVELNPANAKALTRIGRIWYLAQRGELSKQHFDKALEADPNYPPAYRELAELYYATGQKQKAVETYRTYLQLAEKSDETQFRYAQFLFLTKDFEETSQVLDALHGKIDKAVYWRLRAYTACETGNYEKALQWFSEYWKRIDPSKVIASDYEYQAKSQLKTSDYTAARQSIYQAVARDSSKAFLLADLAKAYHDKKLFDSAAYYYQQKILVYPRGAQVVDFFNLGRAYYQAEAFRKADSAFAMVVRLNPQWPIGYFWRARSQQGLDNPNVDSVKGLAVPYYLLTIEKSRQDTARYAKEREEAFEYLGNINLVRNNYGVAIYYCEKALTLNPGNTILKTNLTLAKERYKPSKTDTLSVKSTEGGFLLSLHINGVKTETLITYSDEPLIVNAEGAATLGLVQGESGLRYATIKLADRTVSAVPVQWEASSSTPIRLGITTLFRLNVVPDASRVRLLLR